MNQESKGCMNQKKSLSNKGKLFFVIFISTISVYLTFRYLLTLIFPFIAAYCVAKLLLPAVTYMKKKWRVPKTLSGSILLILFFLVVGVIVIFLGKNLIMQIKEVFQKIPVYQDVLFKQIGQICTQCDTFLGIPVGNTFAFVDNSIDNMAGKLQSNMMPAVTEQTLGILAKLFSILASVIIAAVAVLMLLADYEEIKCTFQKFPFYPEIRLVTKKMSGAGATYLKAQCILLSTIAGVITIGLIFIGNKYALLLGILIAIVDAFPVLGSGTVLVPWAVVQIFTKDIFQAAVLISLYFITQLIRQFLEPKLIGDGLGIKPIFSIISMYIGIRLFGVAGVFLGPMGLILIRSIMETYLDSNKGNS